MAIQMRRGAWDEFDPTRLLPGEWAVVTSGDPEAGDGKAVYVCFSPGDVKRMTTIDEMTDFLIRADEAVGRAEAAAEVVEDYTLDDVPLMSSTVRGGAQLGSGLVVASGKLSVNPVTQTELVAVTSGSGPTGSNVLDLTGVSYLWDKLKTWVRANHVWKVKGDAETSWHGGEVNITPAMVGAAPTSHEHSAADVTSGTLPVTRGGTGATSASDARSNLGAAAASHEHSAADVTSGTLPVSRGGTGSSTAANARTALGAASQEDMDDAEQAIADNAAAIATLGESVNQLQATSTSGISFTANSGWSVSINAQHRVGSLVFAYVNVTPSAAVAASASVNPIKVAGVRTGLVSSDRFSGHIGANGQVWLRSLVAVSANTSASMMLVMLIQ